MSLPNKAIFYKDNEIIEKLFINCGWFYEGRKSTLKVLFDMLEYQEKYPEKYKIPSDFDSVKIYEEEMSYSEFFKLLKEIKDKGK